MKRFLLLLFAVNGLSAPAYSQTHNDGPVEVTMRVRDIRVTAPPTDIGFFGAAYATEEYTFYLWGRDNADLDAAGWQGGTLLTQDFATVPGNTVDFNQVIFNYIYTGTTVPEFLEIRIDAWEDESGDALSGVGCNSTRGTYQTGFCCGGEFSGTCLGSIDDDDNHCDGNPFITGLNYRLGNPGGWYDHGYLTGTCANNYYQPHIETYWRYVNGDSQPTAIDLGTLNAGSHALHTNNTTSYTSQYPASSGNDVFYKITTSEAGALKASLCGAAFDTYLYLLASDGSSVASNDNACGTASEIQHCGLPAGTYYLVVDGPSTSSKGLFTLNVELEGMTVDFGVDVTTGCAPLTVNFTDATASASAISDWHWDFGDGATSNAQNPSHGYSTEGAFDVSLTVTAINGCVVTVTKNDIINTSDITPPGITCPGDQTVTADASCVFMLPDYTGMATAIDNCGGAPTVTQAPPAGTIITATQTITLTAADAAGNTAQCTFNAIPQDNTPPLITCPPDQQVVFDATCRFTLPDYTTLATATDNCATPIVTQAPPPGTVISATQAITITTTDGAGNTAQCAFNVIPEDHTLPLINCPANQQVAFDASCGFTLPDYTTLATASDNCGTPTVSQSPLAGTVITASQTVTLTVTDGAGNTAQCTFDVIPQDNTPPVISCPVDQQVAFDASCRFTLPDYTSLATAGDNCGAPTVTQAPPMGTVITASQIVTLTATDGAGNTTQCTFDVIPEDNTPPLINCPANQQVISDVSCRFTLPDYTGMATASDNCGTPAIAQSPLAGTVITATQTVTLTATDGAGNTTQCTFDVIPEDNTLPLINCPANQQVAFDASCGFTLPDYTTLATASDNCGTPTVSQSPLAGTVITASQTVTLTATDGVGNTAQCIFDVVPNDVTLASITCPANVGSCNDVITFPAPVTPANCSGQTVTLLSGLPGGSVFPVGITTNTYEVKYGNGNTATCSFTITRYTPVSITLGTDVTINAGFSYKIEPVAGNADTFEWIPPDGLDEAFSASPTASPQRTTLYTVTASSDQGCSASDDILITVKETLEINNFMSPNGDGKNDTWEIKGSWLLSECRVEIFNALGNSVFSTTGYDNTWDGISHGTELPDGVYYYIISCDNQAPLTGGITLIRK